jgi:hypothetical protein
LRLDANVWDCSGEAEASEEESEHGVDAGNYAYDDYPEEAAEVTGQELMEIDGRHHHLLTIQCADVEDADIGYSHRRGTV